MAEFIFMLTHHDATVPDALAVYETLRDSRLVHVGFKDIGVPAETLSELTRRAHADGRTVYLEVVSVSASDEMRSVQVAREIGVDIVMGGTHPTEALPILAGGGQRYYPFAGHVVGHPSTLEGTPAEIAASAAELTAINGVDGVDLLGYRNPGDVPAIISAVVAASRGPVVVAGNIDSRAKIVAVTELGAWGFTIGGAIFEGVLPAGSSVRAQVDWALACAREASAAPE